jgi:hypothetical protein
VYPSFKHLGNRICPSQDSLLNHTVKYWLEKICCAYKLPSNSNNTKTSCMDDNPHCSLYEPLHPDYNYIYCYPSEHQATDPPAALTLLFSFKPKSGYDLTVTNHDERKTNKFLCKKNQFINEASKMCIHFSDNIGIMMSPKSSINLSSSHISDEKSVSFPDEANVRHFLDQNCSKAIFDISYVVFYPNLSIFVPSTGH